MRSNWITDSFMALACVSVAFAQSNIDPAHRFCWGEGPGWMDWREAGGGADGVVVHDTFLSGYIWSEGAGWIWLGDGTPVNGESYANEDGTDFGVNVDPDSGELSGYAWSEGAGWAVFGTTPYVGTDGARFDWDEGRFRGYAWSEGGGWILLDHEEFYVSVAQTCAACRLHGDVFPVGPPAGDCVVDLDDILCALTGFANQMNCPMADIVPCGGDEVIDLDDILSVLGAFAGVYACPHPCPP